MRPSRAPKIKDTADELGDVEAACADEPVAEDASLVRHRAWVSEVSAREAAVAAETEAQLRRRAEADLEAVRREADARQATIETLSARLAQSDAALAALRDGSCPHERRGRARARERAGRHRRRRSRPRRPPRKRTNDAAGRPGRVARSRNVAARARRSGGRASRRAINASPYGWGCRLPMQRSAARLATSLGEIREAWMEAFLWNALAGEPDDGVRTRLLGSLGRAAHFRDAKAWERAWREGSELERCAIEEVLEGHIEEAPWIAALLQRLRVAEAEAVVV